MYEGIDSRVFELLHTVVRVEPTGVVIDDDWTHGLYVWGVACSDEYGRALHSVIIILCPWRTGVGDLEVRQFWNVANGCVE
jgi:hypothetical protein